MHVSVCVCASVSADAHKCQNWGLESMKLMYRMSWTPNLTKMWALETKFWSFARAGQLLTAESFLPLSHPINLKNYVKAYLKNKKYTYQWAQWGLTHAYIYIYTLTFIYAVQIRLNIFSDFYSLFYDRTLKSIPLIAFGISKIAPINMGVHLSPTQAYVIIRPAGRWLEHMWVLIFRCLLIFPSWCKLRSQKTLIFGEMSH